MENNFQPDSDAPRTTADVLAEMQADRERLAQVATTPRWFAPSFGLVAAAFVANPALPTPTQKNSLMLLSLALCTALILWQQKNTGIKMSRFGVRQWLLFSAGVVGTLALLSVSLGLAAAGLVWWIAVPAATAFVLVWWLAATLNSSLRNRVTHV